MKVIFNCGSYSFHRDYYENIAKELAKRGHKFEFLKEGFIEDADFTITADEAQISMGGKVVWIGHSFDAKGAMWNNPYYLSHLQENSDYAFVYSEEYKRTLEKYYTKPIYVSGMAKLDGLFNVPKNQFYILYAPTFNKELSADNVLHDDIYELSKFGEVLVRKHPAFTDNKLTLEECLRKASVVISDYSSAGMEAIVLNIPTILVRNPEKSSYKTFPDDHYVCNRARKATVEISNIYELTEAVRRYKNNAHYLEKERSFYGKELCEYQDVSAKRTVDLLEELCDKKTNIDDIVKDVLPTDKDIKRVEIFVLHHSVPDETIKCLSSLLGRTDWPYKITVLDTSMYRKGLLAKIYNKLIKESTCDYVAFMCSDADFVNPWLKSLMKTLADKDVGCVVPLIKPPMNPSLDIKIDTGLHEISPTEISMSISLFRKKDLMDCGIFNENFYLYGHDVDLLKRLSKKYKLILDSSVLANHKVGTTTKRLFSKKEIDDIDIYNKKIQNGK